MDSALELKIKVSENQVNSFPEARPYLEKSALFQTLLAEFELTSINLLHRLIELSEIPYSQEYEQTQKWRDKLADLTFCGEGFSLTGKKDDLLACYNAMITTVLIKLDYPDLNRISKGVDWILTYQNTRRNQTNNWKGKGIQKYGGCMKSTPCFIGVVKSMVTLTEFKKKRKNQHLDNKLKSGIEYILEHKVYKRKSTDQPITKDITKLTYPFTYKTNIIEILRLLRDNRTLNDTRIREAKEFLFKKQKKDGSWKINASYKPKHWVDFDHSNSKAEWLNYEIKNSMHSICYE